MLHPHERQVIEATLNRFSEHIEEVLFSGEEDDGDLQRVRHLLDESWRLIEGHPAACLLQGTAEMVCRTSSGCF